MKFISAKYVPSDWIKLAEENNATINVRFCRDCPLFEYDCVQPDPKVSYGWCRMSYYIVDDGDYAADVTSNSFCNENEIGDEALYPPV